MLTLYDYFRSSACYRVRIALQLKGINHKSIPIHLVQDGGQQFTNAYQAINPHSLVPSLRDDDKIITQSLAIIEYLDECYPTPALLPNDPFQKALVRSFALSIIADIHPLNNLRVMNYLKTQLKVSDQEKNAWYQHWITTGLQGLEKQLTRYALSGYYCFGDQPTLADICLIPQLYNAKRFACDLTPYPILRRIDHHCESQIAFIQAKPEKSTTA